MPDPIPDDPRRPDPNGRSVADGDKKPIKPKKPKKVKK